ncbi:MAG: tetratricopeptide repeat protein [Wenzhouxiangellaceae bacterium]|nr:tetratricopeptide repeat protein [Wenzhouxiangellaceae bacterium]
MNVIAELRRRNVFRVALFYLVAAWLVVQVAETVLPLFEVPDGVLRGLIVLLALGFVPALVFAWAFEMTPDGLKRETDVEVSPGVNQRAAHKLNWATLIVALLAIGLLAFDRLMPETGNRSATRASATPSSSGTDSQSGGAAMPDSAPARSIAVLAFDDLSPDADQGYFAEGVSEELLNLLARIDGFKVAARTSSFKFKGTDADIGEIGRALNVETVLEGSVRKAGDQVRVTAQLINVDDGFHLWSASYDRRLDNIFAVQDEIAGAIVEALRLELNIAAETASRTTDVEAYDHYLRGRQLAREPTRSGLLRAIELYERAIAIDPEFAAAYAGIADAWVWLEDYGGIKSAEAFPKAEQAARRALELDPESAEAHAAMGMVFDRYYDDKTGASEYFERTIALNPNFVTAYNLYGDTLRDMGALDRMIEVHRKAVELDPLSVFYRARLASKLITTGALDESRRMIDALLDEFPGNDYALEELGNLEMARGNLAAAADAYSRVHAARPGDPYPAALIARMAVQLEDLPLARRWAGAARQRGEDNRWELFAREQIELWQQDWPALDRVGDLLGGHDGANLRGIAAAGVGDLPEARRHLLEALRMSGYDPLEPTLLQHVRKLTELARIERVLDLPDWRNRLQAARPVLERLVRRGGVESNSEDPHARLARITAVEGDREATLAHFRAAVAAGFRAAWVIDSDPFFSAWREDPEFIALAAEIRGLNDIERARVAGMDLQP